MERSIKMVNPLPKPNSMDKIIVGSEGMGVWGKYIVDYLLKLAYPASRIVWKNSGHSHLIVKSHFTHFEEKWTNESLPYIYWSGESGKVIENLNHSKYIHIANLIDKESKDSIYCPFATAKIEYGKPVRKYNNEIRPYFVAYCASNPVKERETLFSLLVDRDKTNTCYSLGKCNGDNSRCRENKIPGDWKNEYLIQEYSKFRFVFAMENIIKDGYITEKIVNAFKAGAIPIYWGTERIKQFFNPGAFIFVNDFSSLEECAEYLVQLDQNKIAEMRSKPVFKNNSIPEELRVNDINNLYYINHSKKIIDLLE
ncbi:MAG: hypothetical protein GY754_16820 [bacterium]|nr:hypothetical protein [bacterium]